MNGSIEKVLLHSTQEQIGLDLRLYEPENQVGPDCRSDTTSLKIMEDSRTRSVAFRDKGLCDEEIQ
jgi:hypothetical protein